MLGEGWTGNLGLWGLASWNGPALSRTFQRSLHAPGGRWLHQAWLAASDLDVRQTSPSTQRSGTTLCSVRPDRPAPVPPRREGWLVSTELTLWGVFSKRQLWGRSPALCPTWMGVGLRGTRTVSTPPGRCVFTGDRGALQRRRHIRPSPGAAASDTGGPAVATGWAPGWRPHSPPSTDQSTVLDWMLDTKHLWCWQG